MADHRFVELTRRPFRPDLLDGTWLDAVPPIEYTGPAVSVLGCEVCDMSYEEALFAPCSGGSVHELGNAVNEIFDALAAHEQEEHESKVDRDLDMRDEEA